MKVFHVIVGLDTGGAEGMLFRLVQKRQNVDHVVVSLTDIGVFGRRLIEQGVEVHALGMKGFFSLPRVFWSLVRFFRSKKPDAVQTWMYHADLLGGLACWCAGLRNLYWGIRNTHVPNGRFSSTRFVIWLCALLSWVLPKKIICCAHASKEFHVSIGYCPNKMVVIPNGFDFNKYRATNGQKKRLRHALGFVDKDIVIGTVGRFDYLKDYKNFVEASAIVANSNERVKFLLVGRRVNERNRQLMGWIEETQCMERYKLLGERDDVPDLLSVMDVFCLASRAEGFPNVVAEAMAVGVPGVVTDVGDAAIMVENTFSVVPPENSGLLATAMSDIVNSSKITRNRISEQARLLVKKKYALVNIVSDYELLYLSGSN